MMLQNYIKDVPVILKIALRLNRKITPYKYTAKKRMESLGESLKEKTLQFSRLSLPFRY